MKRIHGTPFRALCFVFVLSAAPGLAAQRRAPLPSDEAARILAAPPGVRPETTDSLVVAAQQQLGRRYLFGGDGPSDGGFDCSGFTRYLMRTLGIQLPRTADEQAKLGEEIPRDVRLLRIGDLLTFGTPGHISHIGMYIGRGRFVHASSGAGQIVVSRIDERGAKMDRFWQGVRRVIDGRRDRVAGLVTGR